HHGLRPPRRSAKASERRHRVGILVESLMKSPRMLLAACITLLAANLGAACFLEFTPRVSGVIARRDIQPELGLAYQVPIDLAVRRLYVVPTDTVETPTSSRLTLFEDGRALGPSHSVHGDIREKAGGKFSFWSGSIIFSASDGTDPRTNGLAYSYVSSTKVKPRLQLLL